MSTEYYFSRPLMRVEVEGVFDTSGLPEGPDVRERGTRP